MSWALCLLWVSFLGIVCLGINHRSPKWRCTSSEIWRLYISNSNLISTTALLPASNRTNLAYTTKYKYLFCSITYYNTGYQVTGTPLIQIHFVRRPTRWPSKYDLYSINIKTWLHHRTQKNYLQKHRERLITAGTLNWMQQHTQRHLYISYQSRLHH